MANIQISIINKSTVLTDIEVNQAIPSFQKQIHDHFAPIWGVDADLSFAPVNAQPAQASWQLIILDNADQAGILGYHDLTSEGLPIGKVFAKTDQQYNSSWTVTASHELLEMLGDPDINLTVFSQNTDGSGILYSYETCDACEDDQFGYIIDGVLVSDFVFPSWFELFHSAGTQYDYQNKITQPLQLLTGGYISIYNITSGNGWTQLNADFAELTYKMRPNVGSRRERRRTPRNQWMKSKR